MQQLWPSADAREISDDELERLYAYPEPVDRPWVQANMVSSADGAVDVAGTSRGLSHPADKRIYALGRDLADVVLVGAGTAAAEGYAGVRPRPSRLRRRRRLGRTDVPPLALVSNRCSIPPTAPVFTDTEVAPIVLTTDSAPAERVRALTAAGARVWRAGAEAVDLAAAVGLLAAAGMPRIDCEGGPTLLASMVAAGLVDQLCLTVAPVLAGAGTDRIVRGELAEGPRRMTLVSTLHEDGFLMLRYRPESLTGCSPA